MVHYYAKEYLKFGHEISGKEAYLRASNYYRVAEFFIIDKNKWVIRIYRS